MNYTKGLYIILGLWLGFWVNLQGQNTETRPDSVAQIAKDSAIQISKDIAVKNINDSSQVAVVQVNKAIGQAEFPGGESAKENFLRKNLKYPRKALRQKAQGTVTVNFIIETDGSVTNVFVQKSSGNKELDNEAIRVVKMMPKWLPAVQKGVPVRSGSSLPIRFGK
ncbi:MAG: energy transducer TonB [Bacteroidales bacterium]|jgi:protein TonB|nr:energy transducer TonB [Bacteroidales bacterium]